MADAQIRRDSSERRQSTFDPFLLMCKAHGLQTPVKEFRFCPTRKFRADYCWPDAKLILEVQGGGWIAGRHHRGAGFEKDCERRCIAVGLGYAILEVTPKQMKQGLAVEWAREALAVRKVA